MQSTKSRHGPAASTDACTKEAFCSVIEPERYIRFNAKPIPAMSHSGAVAGLLRTVGVVDGRIGLLDHMDIVIAPDALPHHMAEPHSPLRVSEQLGDGMCGLSW